MSDTHQGGDGRRHFLQGSRRASARHCGLPNGAARAAEAVNFFTWSAGVDQVKSHLAAFEKKTGIAVNYNNAPWAQYRDTMVTKFVGNAPMDTMWVSDSWLPEWASAGWLAPIDGYPELMKYNADVDEFATQSMRYKGKQYGLTYYTDYMSFFYDDSKLKKARHQRPTDHLGRSAAAVAGAEEEPASNTR